MKNKKLPVLVCTLLITTIIPIIGVNCEEIENSEEKNLGYILDQMQTVSIYYDVISDDNSVAQSFKPSLTPLAKVRLLVSAEEQINQPLTVSIRRNLYSEDLTSITVPASEIPPIVDWINFDFPDITVTEEETYFIVVTTDSQIEYHWLIAYNEDVDYYERGSGWFKNRSIGVNWINWDEYEFHQPYNDYCFKTYSYTGIESDLECDDIFGWPDQKPGGVVNDTFTIENRGDPSSLLNWEITEFPEWGNWTFTPDKGIDLTPEDDPIVVNVSVDIPNETNMVYSGEIKIVNKEDNNDFCIISVSLSTSKSKEKNNYDILYSLIQKIIQRFPIIQLFLTEILNI
jgi:hypothetical protein